MTIILQQITFASAFLDRGEKEKRITVLSIHNFSNVAKFIDLMSILSRSKSVFSMTAME